MASMVTLASPMLELPLSGRQLAQVHGVLGSAHRYLGEPETAESHVATALRTLERAGLSHAQERFRPSLTLGVLLQSRGELDAARAVFEEVVAAARAGDHVAWLAHGLAALGSVLLRMDHLDEAHAALEEGCAIATAAGAPLAVLLGKLGLVAEARGHFEVARDLQLRALDAARADGDLIEEGVARSNLANALYQAGQAAEAEAQLREALQIHRRVGDRPSEAIPLANLAVFAMARGAAAEAVPLLEEAIGIARSQDRSEILAGFWMNLAKAHLLVGDPAWEHSIEQALATSTSDIHRSNAMSARGTLRLQHERYDEALADFDAADAIGQAGCESAWPAYGRAVVHRVRGDDAQADAAVAEGDRRAGTVPLPHTGMGKMRARARGEDPQP